MDYLFTLSRLNSTEMDGRVTQLAALLVTADMATPGSGFFLPQAFPAHPEGGPAISIEGAVGFTVISAHIEQTIGDYPTSRPVIEACARPFDDHGEDRPSYVALEGVTNTVWLMDPAADVQPADGLGYLMSVPDGVNFSYSNSLTYNTLKMVLTHADYPGDRFFVSHVIFQPPS